MPLCLKNTALKAERLDFFYVRRLISLRSLDDIERNSLSFIQRLETITLNGAEMNKYVLAIIAGDKPITLCCVKPFDSSLRCQKFFLLM